MISILIRFDNHANADSVWQYWCQRSKGIPNIWLDHISIKGTSHVAVISDDDEAIEIFDVLPDGYDGVEVDWPPNIMESILSLRQYFYQRGVREMELRYSPGMFIPIKHKRDPGTLI